MTGASSVYEQILEFSDKQTPWKQDLLRRVVQHGALSATDLAEAVDMCKAAHGLEAAEPAAPVPLTRLHLPASGGAAAEAVCLTELRDLQDVNALLPGQTLPFAPSGLTTVFGYNGAGKSGYARVLKKLCRARGAVDPVLPDVFTGGGGQPLATIVYRVGDTEQTWTGVVGDDTTEGPDTLSRVGVYDRASGVSFLLANQKVELLPPGLDLLPRLRDGLDHAAAVLKREDRDDGLAVGFPDLDRSTVAGRFLAGLSTKTTAEEVDHAARWSNEDDDALNKATVEVARLKAEDPVKRAQTTKARADRLQRLSTALSKVAHDLRDAIAQRVAEVVEARRCAKKAQALHAGDALPSDALPGTGGEPWRLLWEAARAFSTTVAYPQQPFPAVDEATQCVLCQQELDTAARDRLRAFDAFVKDELARKLEAAVKSCVAARQHLLGAVPAALTDGDLRGEEATVDDTLPADIDAFLERTLARREALLAHLDDGHTQASLPAIGPAPVAKLEQSVADLCAKIDKLQQENTTEALSAQQRLVAELSARKTLHTAKAMLHDEVARLTRVARRKRAARDCSTSSLSQLARKLTEQFVTEALVEAFNQELVRLGGARLRVSLEGAGARKGESYTGLVLRDPAQEGVAVVRVLSEGEQRAVGLATFFADLQISSTRSAIVFDDPVSSLDHRWRGQVAQRLVEEAQVRQVIVFTHDAVFLAKLDQECRRAGVDHTGVHIQRKGQAAGFCSDDPPFEVKTVKQRIGSLKNDHVQLVKVHRTGSDQDYARAVTALLDRLRKTWERAVEECFLNDSIQRFDYGIHTQQLKHIDVDPGDYPTIEAGMGRCSAWVHDQAQGLATPPPSPREVAELVNELVDWVRALRQRRPKQGLPSVKPIDVGGVA